MIPVLDPEEMGWVDRSAPEPPEVLVGRAGAAVAAAARRLLGGCYGRRVIVVAGPGNNGADGRTAAAILRRRGAKVVVLDARALDPGEPLPPGELVIDAAYGTGLSRPYHPPDPRGAAVLAVDIPSGISGATGAVVGEGGALFADTTVTFAAYKPGLLLGEGRQRCGRVELYDIGLGELAASRATAWLVTDEDVGQLLPRRPWDTHKWQAAVQVVGGSPGMTGAPMLVALGALRAGAGYARVGVPGGPPGGGLPPGAYVAHDLPERGWADAAAAGTTRARALVVGPGLGPRTGGEGSEVAALLQKTDVPAVVDADGIGALGGLEGVREVTASRRAPVVLTPHTGEFVRLTGEPPGIDRLAAVREAARRSGAIVLLKGSTTIVAHPGGRALIAAAGSSRLATAGTGDVLSGVIGAFLARGLGPLEAAALAAHCHGRAAGLGPATGLVATDLPDLVCEWLSRVAPG